MRNSIDDYIKYIKSGSEGECHVFFSEFFEIYIKLKKPKTNLVKVFNNIYISFENNPKISFHITDKTELDDFLSIKNINIADADKDQKNLFWFIVNEFLQEENFFKKCLRFIYTITPSIILNILLLNYATKESLISTYNAILTSLSLFIAIFVLFAINQSYWERKKLNLFRSGKISYYFSVDRNITNLGVISIIASLIGILITPSENAKILLDNSIESYIGLFLINLIFIFTFILFRSISEFYMPRPAKFILGDLKKESLETFN